MAPVENGVDLNTLVFSKLTPQSDISSFRCSAYRDLEDFLLNDALKYQEENVAVTYLVHSDGRLVGFFSLAMGCVASESVADLGEERYYPRRFPALLIARMATQDNFRGMGIGAEMLARVFATAFTLCSKVGCRVVKVDAKNNERTINFYERHGGFITVGSGDETIPMIVDMNKMPPNHLDVEKTLADFT
ncbi:MAG: GNAT family N-acetyltransferase [Methanoregula sp.]|nr:GNAT family N-acetyltransferase [Methanoregula sp.]